MVPEYLATGAPSLADPLVSSPLVSAVVWLETTLLGTIATTVAIVSVASVGMMMLSGQVSFRRGLTVVAGCFILFGASSIVAGIQATALGSSSSELPIAVVELPPPVVIPTPSTEDPYAGAAPKRRR